MNVEGLLGSLITGALGARRKPHLRAGRFLTGGGGSLLNAGNLLTAAALGWGAYEIWRTRNGAAATNPAFGGPGVAPPPMPPLPAGSSARSTVEVVGDPEDGLRRIAALLVAAARSDGELSEAEYGKLMAEARAAGAEKGVLAELSAPRPLEQVVAGVHDPKLAADLYTLAFAVVRADGGVNATERAWLDRLGVLLRIEPASIERLEADAARGIARAT